MGASFVAELFGLEEKVALVTGASRGIGAGIARYLARAGASVAIADLDLEGASALAKEVRAAGGRAAPLSCDVSKPANLDDVVAKTVSTFGRLDILVNNAGVFPFGAALELTEEIWDRVIGINLRGAFFLAQRVAREMIREAHGGSIINITSVDALKPTGMLAHYDASKGGLQMLTRSLALEFARYGIRVNAVAPGSIETPGVADAQKATGPAGEPSKIVEAFLSRIPLHRMGKPEDIASVVLFLAGRGASYITGSTIVADGGYLLA